MGRLRLIVRGATFAAALLWLGAVQADTPAPGHWTLVKMDRVVHLASFGAIVAEHYDAKGGSVDMAVDGRALDLCGGGSETMHFDWQFPQDIARIGNGETRAVVIEAQPLHAINNCVGNIAAGSTIAATSSGSWPYDDERKQIDVDRVGITGPYKAFATKDGENADSPGISFAPWPLKADQPFTYFYLAISLRGAGEVDYVYMYKSDTGDTMSLEPGVDRPGSDYTHFDATGALACQASCATDASCKAFTFVNPGIQAPAGQCWLKSAVPPGQPAYCCTSGVRH